MKQSERMRLYLEFNNHPLKTEYLSKKRGMKHRKLIDKWYIALKAVPFILILVFGYLFFSTDDWNEMCCYTIVGLINLYICFKVLNSDFSQHWEETEDYQKLKDEYEAKGLYEVDDPFREECGEYNDDGMFVCSATQQPLTFEEKQWCQTKGNCENCARFLRCMGFDIDDWSEEMRSEIQKW